MLPASIRTAFCHACPARRVVALTCLHMPLRVLVTQPTATSDALLCAKDEGTAIGGVHVSTRLYPVQSLYASLNQREGSRITKSSSARAPGRSNLPCASILRRNTVRKQMSRSRVRPDQWGAVPGFRCQVRGRSTHPYHWDRGGSCASSLRLASWKSDGSRRSWSR